MKEITQWIIQTKEGRKAGPFSSQEVIRKIRSGVYLGEESISRYPTGHWCLLSQEEQFFDVLIEVLEEDLLGISPLKEKERKELTERITLIKEENKKKVYQKTPFHQKREKGQAVPEDLDEKTPVIIEIKEKGKERVKQNEVNKKIKRPVKKKIEKPVFLKKNRTLLFQFLIFFVISVFTLTIYFFIDSKDQDFHKIHLKAPNLKRNIKYDKKTVVESMQRGIEAFRKDNFKNYLVAQSAFIEVIEASNSLEAYSFLCMTYRELWPFSYQDSKDHNVLQRVLRRVQKINPKSSSANICFVVSKLIKGQYDDALRIMDARLSQSPELIFFNLMIGDIYAGMKDYQAAIYYFSKVRELWKPPPIWSKALIQEARMHRKLKDYGSSIKLYGKLLKENPSHAVAQVEMGLLEFDPYQNISKSQIYIHSGLASKQYIPKMIESEAYLTLAKISILKGDNKKALKFAQKAFSINSGDQTARELIVNLGGIKALNSVSINNVNMVYLGEQYMKTKNFAGAQAEFRGAYTANPKNAFAALRAGEALWKLNQSNEAIRWVKKSIHTDPKFIRGYIILSDYQSIRFDYINAIETLKAALRINPRHNGIYRGFALIELRRGNYPGAVRFARKALELYDTDVETLIILSKALKKDNPEEAFQYIQQALELDYSNHEVHITYADILSSLQGTDAGINYLNSLINKYGKTDYMRALGDLFLREEKYSQAKEYYFEAINENLKDKKSLIALAKIAQFEKDYEKARDYLLEAAILDPSDAHPLFLTGQLYLELNYNAEALKQFEGVISVNHFYPLAHYFAGRTLLKQGKLDEALEMATKERHMNPDIPESFLLAGEIYYQKGQYNSCTDEYRMVLNKGLKTADVLVKMGRCYRLQGNFDSSMTMLSEAESIESGNFNIYRELGALYQAQGGYEKSVEFYKKYLLLNPKAKDKSAIENEISKMQ